MLKDDDTYLVLLTEHGWIKKTPASAFAHITSRGLAAIKIEKGDRLGWALKCTSENSIILATRGGFATRFLTDKKQLRVTRRTSRGSMSMKLRENDVIVDASVLPAPSDADNQIELLCVTA